MASEKVDQFSGIIPPMVTPLLDQSRLDIDGLARLVEHLLAGGVSGLFLLGTTGEGPSLSLDVQCQLIRETVRRVNGRRPVLVCVTDPSLESSVELAQYAAKCGADAVVTSVPYYYPLEQDALLTYVRQFAGSISLPFLLYNIPQMVGTKIDVDTVRRLLDIEKFVGIKDSSGDLNYLRELVEIVSERENFSVLSGTEETLVDAIRIGAQGGVSGGANLFPKLHVSSYNAIISGNHSTAETLQQTVVKVSEGLYTIQRHSSRYVNSIKAALSSIGICGDAVALPLLPFNTREQHLLTERLEEIATLECADIREVLQSRASSNLQQDSSANSGGIQCSSPMGPWEQRSATAG